MWRWVSALAAVALLTVAAGCGSGNRVEDADVMGVNAEVGKILLRSVHVEAPAQPRYVPGQDARVWLTLINTGSRPDALVEVTSPVAEEVAIEWDRDCDDRFDRVAALPLAPAEPAVADPPTAAVPFDAYHLEMIDLTREVLAGRNVPLSFRFERAGEVTVHAHVQPHNAPRAEPSTRCAP